jgi:spore coat polysaccharide biosynthesis predicted glycosyltransferase SpsG
MGHLFRMLNLAKYLKKQNENFIFVINDNEKTKSILKEYAYIFEVVDLLDISTHWEQNIIDKYDIKYWINDRLDTLQQHSLNIKNNDIKLITFDNLGSGAKYSDINICGLFFNKEKIYGKKILKGVEYLILNEEIDKYKKHKEKLANTIVTLGGSDTYGVTIKVLKLLKKYNIKATIHIGPSFVHKKELDEVITDDYKLITFVPSLIEELSKYDLAITGGGITPFEANALGVPCIIIANELFEISNGNFLNNLKSSKFIGYYDKIDESIFENLDKLDIRSMSKNGLDNLNTQAVEELYKAIKND